MRDAVSVVFGAIMLVALVLVVVTVRDARPAESKLGWRLEACGGMPYDCRALSDPLPSMICTAMADALRSQLTGYEAHCRPVLINGDE